MQFLNVDQILIRTLKKITSQYRRIFRLDICNSYKILFLGTFYSLN